MGLCLLVVSAHRHALYRPGLWALCAAVLVSAVYLGGLLMMYLFSMPTGEAMILASLERYLGTLDLWLVLMTIAVALASLEVWPPQGRARFLRAAAAGLAVVALLFFSGFPEASVINHRQLYSQSDRAKIDAALAEQDVPVGQRYILAGMQDGGRAYYIFQYLLDPAFLSLNLENWRQADAILIYDPNPWSWFTSNRPSCHPGRRRSSTICASKALCYGRGMVYSGRTVGAGGGVSAGAAEGAPPPADACARLSACAASASMVCASSCARCS